MIKLWCLEIKKIKSHSHKSQAILTDVQVKFKFKISLCKEKRYYLSLVICRCCWYNLRPKISSLFVLNIEIKALEV